MSAMSDYLENKLIDHIFRAQTFTAPTTLYFALLTAAPNDASTGATITEVANSNNYARASVTCSLANFAGTQSAGSTTASSGTGGVTSNNGTITFNTPSGNWGTVTHIAVLDSGTHGAGNVLFHGALAASKTINNGDPGPTFAAAAFTLTLA